MDKVMAKFRDSERVIIGADFNRHVGEENSWFEHIAGKFGFGIRNAGGDKIIEFGLKHELLVTNTFFKKKTAHNITYKSGGNETQVDYILYMKGFKKEITDYKVIAGEAVALQHRVVVCRLKMEVKNRSDQEIREKKLNWWKLERYKEFLDEVKSRCTGVLPDS